MTMMMIRQDEIIDEDKMTDNDKMIEDEMMKMKGGQQKCQINNRVAMMCEDPRVQNKSHDGKL